MPHWKNLADYNYMGAYSFEDNKAQEVVVTISGVEREKVTAPGGKTDYCVVGHFKESNVDGIEIKPMVLNKTNCKAIEKALGTPDTDLWIGKSVTVFKTQTKYQRDIVDCLRIKDTAPAPKYTCSVCGKALDKAFYEGSINKYGVALCSAECKKRYDESIANETK